MQSDASQSSRASVLFRSGGLCDSQFTMVRCGSLSIIYVALLCAQDDGYSLTLDGKKCVLGHNCVQHMEEIDSNVVCGHFALIYMHARTT